MALQDNDDDVDDDVSKHVIVHQNVWGGWVRSTVKDKVLKSVFFLVPFPKGKVHRKKKKKKNYKCPLCPYTYLHTVKTDIFPFFLLQ